MKLLRLSRHIAVSSILGYCFFLPSTSLGSEIFKYTDSSGVTHYVDSKEKVPEEYQEQLSSQKSLPSISKVSPGREKLYEKTHYSAPVKRSGVEIYVTDWCGYCRKLEEFLDQQGIAYTSFDIEKDKSAKRRHAALGSGVPITRVGTKIISGYRPEEILQATKSK